MGGERGGRRESEREWGGTRVRERVEDLKRETEYYWRWSDFNTLVQALCFEASRVE